MTKKSPGYCVECFVHLDPAEIICGACQDNSDGRNQHLFQIKYEREKGELNGKKKSCKS